MPILPSIEKSLWRESSSGQIYPQLEADVEADVVIVGAGITGLTSAYLLKQQGLKVAVIEKDTVGGGTTGRTTGKVSSQHGINYQGLIDKHGGKTAKLYGQAMQSAVNKVEEIINKEKISCDWQADDNYVFTTERQGIGQIKKEAEVSAKLGLPASFVTSTPLPFSVKGAVKFSNQGKFNSQKYLLGLAKAVHGKGSLVFENSKVTGIHDGSPAHIRTAKAKVSCKHIIVATNVPTLPLMARGGYCVLEYPTESYIIAGKLKDELKGMYITPDDNHYSILPVDVGKESYLLIGGGGHISGMRLSREKRFQKLAAYASEKFAVTEITHKWSDRDYLSYDQMPLIGRLYPWSKNLYVGTAYKKWGLSGGTAAGIILSDLIAGKTNPWADVFSPQRLGPIKSIPSVAYKYLTGQN